MDTWGEVRRLRIEFADGIAGLSANQWDTPSWCAGWRVRDVLGHLVSMRETKLPALGWEIIRNGFRPDRAVDRLARASGDQPVPELVERLRRAGDRPVRACHQSLLLVMCSFTVPTHYVPVDSCPTRQLPPLSSSSKRTRSGAVECSTPFLIEVFP